METTILDHTGKIQRVRLVPREHQPSTYDVYVYAFHKKIAQGVFAHGTAVNTIDFIEWVKEHMKDALERGIYDCGHQVLSRIEVSPVKYVPIPYHLRNRRRR